MFDNTNKIWPDWSWLKLVLIFNKGIGQVRPLTSKLRLTSMGACFTLLISLWYHKPGFSDYLLPELGNNLSQTLTWTQERKIGARAMGEIYRSPSYVQDHLLQDYINAIGKKIAHYSSINPNEFEFFLINDPNINAFAMPGGFIGINTGTLMHVQTEAELASILAHEITHVTQRHIASMLAKSEQFNITNLITLATAVLVGVNNPEIASGAIAASIAGMSQMAINFSRENEQEADRIGMQLLTQAGYSPHSMYTLFARMHQENLTKDFGIQEFLRTHPLSMSRMADLKSRALAYPEVTVTDPMPFLLMQARAFALTNAKNNKVTHFVHNLEQNPKVTQTTVSRYLQSLSYLQLNQFDKVLATLKTPELSKEQLPLLLAHAQAQFQLGLQKQDLTLQDKAMAALDTSNWQQSSAVASNLATMALQRHEYQRGYEILQKHRRHHELKIQDLLLLAQLAQGAEKDLQANLAQAEYLTHVGLSQEARNKLELALKQAQNDYEKEILTRKIAAVAAL